MKVPKDIEDHFNKCFDFHLNHFMKDLIEYRKCVIETMKETELKHNTLDKLFTYELAEQAFVYKSKILISKMENEIKNKENLFNEIEDILNQ